jgi:MacB-like periplasmic core domain
MRLLSIAKSFFQSLLHRRQIDTELDDEIHSPVELLADQKIAEGMNPEQARRAARIELGGVERVTEAVRDGRVSEWLDTLACEVRFGLRVLQRNPGFTAVAVLTLALGIGANTAIFSVADAVLLNPVSFPHPNRLVDLYEKTNTTSRAGIPHPDLLDWQRDNHSFEGLAGYLGDELTLTGSGKPARIPGERVSANFFSVLGGATDPRTSIPQHRRPSGCAAGGANQ